MAGAGLYYERNSEISRRFISVGNALKSRKSMKNENREISSSREIAPRLKRHGSVRIEMSSLSTASAAYVVLLHGYRIIKSGQISRV